MPNPTEEALLAVIQRIAANPDDPRLRRWAEGLSIRSAVHRHNEQFAKLSEGKTQAGIAIAALQTGAQALRGRVEGLGLDAARAINDELRAPPPVAFADRHRPLDLSDLVDEIEVLAATFQAALLKVRSEGKDGAPAAATRKPAAAEITRTAAGIFTAATGRRVTLSVQDGVARGPFVAFLAEVFAVLKIKASAEAQTRSYQGMEKARAKAGQAP